MNRQDRDWLLALLLLGPIAWVTGEWWLLWAAIGGSIAAALLGPILRYYRAAPPQQQKMLILVNQVLAAAILAFYVWLVPDLSGGTGAVDWVPWMLVLAVPVVIFMVGIVAWRRVGENSSTAP